jgi:hypothetical protein
MALMHGKHRQLGVFMRVAYVTIGSLSDVLGNFESWAEGASAAAYVMCHRQ